MTGKSIAALCSAVFMVVAATAGCFSPQYRENMPCSGLGDCPPGQTCAHDTCVSCQPIELCNMVDDDCDGVVDEECPCVDGDLQACGPGYCPDEKKICVGGRWSSCEGARQPEPEVCGNFADEDCNGIADDECPCTPVGVSFKTNCGPCQDGVQTCTASGLGPCENASPGIDCCPTDTRMCGTATGACLTGTEACTLGGRWSGVCSGTGPQRETCNGVDDDCDGATDEGAQCPCLWIGNIQVHDMAPQLAGDPEFAGHGPFVRIATTYSIAGAGSRVCAQVVVTMQETSGGTSLASKTVFACSGVAPIKIVAVTSENTIHSYTDNDTSAGGVWDEIGPQTGSGIRSIRCVGDTGGADICNGGSNFTDCSKCELLEVCPFVRYGP